MKIIGLTGGIGSGKSFVADVATGYFRILHINTDDIARVQMLKGGVSFEPVVNEFSKYTDGLIGPDGEIDRKILGRIVLKDENLLAKLDAITHPKVIEEIHSVIASEIKKGQNEAILIETALLYESGIDKICDEVWYVYAPQKTRRKRLSESRGYSEEKIDSFFSNQKSEAEFLKRADRIVPNGDDVTEDDMRTIISAFIM